MVAKSIVEMTRYKEFYGHVISQFEKVFVQGMHQIPTAAVGRRNGERLIKFFCNLHFVKGLSEGASNAQWLSRISFVVEHEILHCVFRHIFMRFEDRLRANIAADCVVNGLLSADGKDSFVPPNMIHPVMYDFPVDKSIMWYYENLKDNKKYQEQCRSGQFGVDGLLSHIGKSHAMWDELINDPLIEETVKDVLRKARDLCTSGYGNIPGKVVEEIDSHLAIQKQKLPWNRILRLFCASATESNLSYTMKKKSRRFGTRPGTSKEDVLNLAVCIDTSGSISDSQLVSFWSEIRWIYRNGASIDVFECDTQLASTKPTVYRGKWSGKVNGRGGTSLEPALARCEGNYDALVYFTDFDAPKVSRKYNIPLLWVLTKEYEQDADLPYEWGRRVVIPGG